MKKITIITIALLLIVGSASAQMKENSDKVKAAMSRLSVMNGTWEGDGWTMSPTKEKTNSHVLETLTWKLDNTLLLIEDVGTNDSGEVELNALATVFYDPREKVYKMHSHLAEGNWTAASFEIIKDNKKFKWTITTRGAVIVYTITIENGIWFEEGSYSRIGSDSSMKFFEMTLTKKE